ncbi:hypothetical protein E0485_18785 [Paenibacillus albiflavus]|uniref:Uncharacterized protein n=1 Tax=Paenibacillus albiflavus TaxID=2545760 RepID=A0A4R4E8L0_9BACL|nr:hypothetical protein [Paenibacillus albiflavus]TCZ75190.1 hypothetical protein E0485_18785 [Paenibacillus albiflavus]
MGQSAERVRELLDASIQIIDHMEENGAAASKVQQIKQALQQQADQMSSSSSSQGTSSIDQILQLVNQLEDETGTSYQQATGGGVEQFESKSLDEQLHASQAYHEKIDYKSMKKVKENLEQILTLSQA